MKRPMIAAAIASVLLSAFVLNASFFALLAVIIITVALLIFCVAVRRFRDFIAVFVVALAVLLNAFFVLEYKISRVENIPENVPVAVSGTVISENYFDGKAAYVIKTDSSNTMLPANININVYSKFAALTEGEKIKCEMYVQPVTTENTAKYYSNGVYASANIKNVLERSRPVNLRSTLAAFRDNVTNKLFSYLTPQSAASVNALTVGDKYYLSGEFEELVRRSGVSHIMVVSGMHMAIICGTLLKALEKLRLGKRIACVITAVSVFLFMALCGFSMSVMRAGITYFIMLAALFLIRRTDALNSLCVAVSIILIINPFAVGSIAFVLSVMSTAGIIILSGPIADKIKNRFNIKIKLLSLIIDAVSVTLSALISTLPFTVYYFGAVSTVAVITNLLIGEAVTLALITAAVALPFAMMSSFSVIANGLFFLTEYITRYFNFIIEYFGSLPFAYVGVNRDLFIISYLAIILSFVIIKYIENIKRVVNRCAGCIRAGSQGKYKE